MAALLSAFCGFAGAPSDPSLLCFDALAFGTETTLYLIAAEGSSKGEAWRFLGRIQVFID
jgi:hypothetical protein